MDYYIFIQDENLNGAGQCKQLTEGVTNFEVDEDLYNAFVKTPDKYIWDGENVVENPDYEKEQAQKREKTFNVEFFNTSLGYIRRNVTMKDGTTKSFLTDLLPLMRVGVPIIAYEKPDFTKDLTEEDYIALQKKAIITEDFLAECQNQVIVDFYGFNPME